MKSLAITVYFADYPLYTVYYDLISLMDKYLASRFTDHLGIPTVQEVANHLNISSRCLSDMLKMLTGQSTQQHIHEPLIERAKEMLTTTNLNIAQIAYQLGLNILNLSTNYSSVALNFHQLLSDNPSIIKEVKGIALSLLYAVVSEDVSGGSLSEPDQNGYRGYPTLANIKENALNKKLWRQNFLS